MMFIQSKNGNLLNRYDYIYSVHAETLQYVKNKLIFLHPDFWKSAPLFLLLLDTYLSSFTFAKAHIEELNVFVEIGNELEMPFNS